MEGVLQAAEESERRDPKGIQMRAREAEADKGEGGGWDKLQDVLSGSSRVQEKGKGRQEKHHSSMGPVSTVGELQSLLGKWEAQSNGNIRLEVLGNEGREPHGVNLVLKRVMRSVLLLEWEGGERSRTCMVERVACFGLKEEAS